jgi:dimethylglycine dehydrogenase
LKAATQAPLDNQAFRWLSAQEITVAGVEDVRAMRVTYTGELGWELHVPMAGMRAVYDALVAAGDPMGMVHVGSAALNAMRMEKAYKSGHEITNEVTLAEADLTRFARADGFQGAAASLAAPSRWKIALLRLEESEGVDADPLGSESVWKDDACVGSVASGGYGYATGAYLAWAYLRPALTEPGTRLEVMTLGRRRAAVVIDGAMWDAGNLRPRQDFAAAAE